MNRRTLLKIAAWGAGGVLLLLVVLTILVKVIISPELVKKTILPKLSVAINRQVSLGDVSVSIFTGIRLHDLVIQDKEGGQPFVKAGALRLDYRFWPLLRKRVEITDIRLESSLVRIVRNADGSFNFSDLLATKQPPAVPKEKSPINLAISKIILTDGRLVFDDRQGIGGRPYQVELGAIQLTAQKISMDGEFPFSLQAVLPGGASCDITGNAARVGSAPAIGLAATVVVKDLGRLIASLPPALAEKPRQLALAGGLELRLQLAGAAKAPGQLLQSGEIRLNDVQLTVGGVRPSLSGQLLLRRDGMTSKNLTLTVADQKLAIGLTGSPLLAKPVSLSVAVQGDRLNLNQLVHKGTAKPGASGGGVAGPQPEPGPLNLPLLANGTVRLNSLVYQTLTITNPSFVWRLADNVLTIDNLKGGVTGGTVSAGARVNLGTPGYSYDTRLALQGIQADQLVTAFAPKASGSVFGTMGLAATLHGRGIRADSLRRNLTGQGSFAITNGKLTGNGFMQGLAGFLKADALRVVRFSRCDGAFGIKGGVVTLSSELNGSDTRIKSGGTASFDKRLNMGLDVRLSPAITGRIARGDLGRFVTDKQGWGMLPLKVIGTIGAPSFMLDAAQVGAQLKGKLAEELSNRLLKGRQGQPQRPEQQLLEQGLKSLFGN